MIKKNPCAFCDRALNLLKGKGFEVEIIDLTGNWDEIQKWKEQTGWQTVPIILIDDKVIGGYSDLKMLNEAGELDALVLGE